MCFQQLVVPRFRVSKQFVRPPDQGQRTACLRVGLGALRTAHSVCLLLCDDRFDDVAVDVGESEVSAGVTVDEVFVVEPHEVEHGGM